MTTRRLIIAALLGLTSAGGHIRARDGIRLVSASEERSLTTGMKECLQFKERRPGERQWVWHAFDDSQPCPAITARRGWPDQALPESGLEVITSFRDGPLGRETYTKTWWDHNYYIEIPAAPGVTQKYKPCTDLVTQPPNIGEMAQRSACMRTESSQICRYGDTEPFRPLCEDRPKWTAMPDWPPPACLSKLEHFLDRQDDHANPSNDFCWRRVDASTALPYSSTTCGNYTYALMSRTESINVIEEIDVAKAITTMLVPLTSGAFNESPCNTNVEVWPDYYYCPSLNTLEWMSVCTQITRSWTSSQYLTRPAARRILRRCKDELEEKDRKEPGCYVDGNVHIFYVRDWDELEPDLCADEPDADRVRSHYSSVHAPGRPIATRVINFGDYHVNPKWNFSSTLSANSAYISADMLVKTVRSGGQYLVSPIPDVWVAVPWSQLSTYRQIGTKSVLFPMNKADLKWPYPRSARRAEKFGMLNEFEAQGTYFNQFMATLAAPPAFHSHYPELDGCAVLFTDPPNGLDPGKRPGRPKVHTFGLDDEPQPAQPTVTLANERGQVTAVPATPASRITSGPAATAASAADAMRGSQNPAPADMAADTAIGLANIPSPENVGGIGDASRPGGSGGFYLAGNVDDSSDATIAEPGSGVAAAAAARASERLPPTAAGSRVEGGFYKIGNPTGGLTLIPNKPIQLANGVVAIANDHNEVQLIDTGDRGFGIEIPLSALDASTGGTGGRQSVVVPTDKLESAFFSAASSKGVTEYRISTSTGFLGQAKEQTTLQQVPTSTKKNEGGSLHDLSGLLVGICGLITAALFW